MSTFRLPTAQDVENCKAVLRFLSERERVQLLCQIYNTSESREALHREMANRRNWDSSSSTRSARSTATPRGGAAPDDKASKSKKKKKAPTVTSVPPIPGITRYLASTPVALVYALRSLDKYDSEEEYLRWVTEITGSSDPEFLRAVSNDTYMEELLAIARNALAENDTSPKAWIASFERELKDSKLEFRRFQEANPDSPFIKGFKEFVSSSDASNVASKALLSRLDELQRIVGSAFMRRWARLSPKALATYKFMAGPKALAKFLLKLASNTLGTRGDRDAASGAGAGAGAGADGGT